jgi:hypothetical protein
MSRGFLDALRRKLTVSRGPDFPRFRSAENRPNHQHRSVVGHESRQNDDTGFPLEGLGVIAAEKPRQLGLVGASSAALVKPAKKKLKTGKDFYCGKKAKVLPSFLWIWKL